MDYSAFDIDKIHFHMYDCTIKYHLIQWFQLAHSDEMRSNPPPCDPDKADKGLQGTYYYKLPILTQSTNNCNPWLA